MSLFRRNHNTRINDNGDGNYNFECSCGTYSRSVPSRRDAETKERLHKENTSR
jgi:hypothetical protein